MEGLKFGFHRSSFLHVVRRAIARHVPLLLGVACFVAAIPLHAQPLVIEANSWVVALERISCLRAKQTADGNWLVSGTFLINGEYFSNPTIKDGAFAEIFRRKCATGGGGGGSSDTNMYRAGGQVSTQTTDYGQALHGHTGGGGSGAGGGPSATPSMSSGTNIPPSDVRPIGAAVAVPSPIAGAGLPGLIAACGALVAFARIRRKKIIG